MLKLILISVGIFSLVVNSALADPCNGRPQDDRRPGCGLTDDERGSGRNFVPPPDTGHPDQTDHAGTR